MRLVDIVARRLISWVVKIPFGLRVAVVAGFPATEEIPLRVAVQLRQQVPTNWLVVLLSDDPRVSLRAAAVSGIALPTSRFAVLRRRSFKGVAAAFVARIWLHTHGLYGSPKLGYGRLSVLLGHGHGPKRAHSGAASQHSHHADLAFTNVATWGRQVIRELGVTGAEVLEAPSPRADAIAESETPPPGTTVSGVDLSRPYLLWLPTMRESIAMSRAQWSDGLPVGEGDLTVLTQLLMTADLLHLPVLSKTHELERRQFSGLPVPTVTTEELLEAGISFQRLIAWSSGVVTDYSSVFVDHLGGQTPVAFALSDEAEFVADRGLNVPDYREVAADLFLRTRADVTEFVHAVADGADWRAQARRALAESIGWHPGDGSTQASEHLVKAVIRRTVV